MKLGKKFIIGFSTIFVIGALLVGGFVGLLLYKNYRELPDIENLVATYTPPIPTTIYDRNDEVIDSLYKEKREVIPLDEMSDYYKKAVISIEDKTFYSHNGLNFKRLLGSIVVNISQGRKAQGASTITQQLSRNAFLTMDKKWSRKIKEMLITFEMERIYTKDEILEKYVNEINFGGGAYGVKSAARQYFRKLPSELNLAESAMLAGIPNRPEKYNPKKSLKDSLQRTHLILHEMLKDGVISEEEYNEALAHEFVILDKDTANKKYDLKKTTLVYDREPRTEEGVPDFTDLVYAFLRNTKDESGERVYSDEMIYNEGLKVYTTVDMKIQKAAKEVFSKNALLTARKDLETGMATIDAGTGEVIAIVGGKNYKTGNFNRGTQAKRQIGSTAKPFLYFAAITNGWDMNSVIDDNKVKFGTWEPKNYGDKYYGNITLLEALDKSLNMVSIKLLERLGVKTLKETVTNLGGEFTLPDNLTASLGTYEGSPLMLAKAYAPFANGGFTVKPSIIKRIEDRNGNVIFNNVIEKDKVYDPMDISMMTYMLESSVRQGTSSRAAVKDRNGNLIDQGGKTGTTNENRTVWFAGITPKYVTTIYLGNDNNTPIAGNITGGQGAAPIWGEFYQKLINEGLYKPEEFSFLNENMKNGNLVKQRLDSKTGLISTEGREFLVRSGRISLETDYKFSRGVSGILSQGREEVAEVPPEPSVTEVITDAVDSTLDKTNTIINRIFGDN